MNFQPVNILDCVLKTALAVWPIEARFGERPVSCGEMARHPSWMEPLFFLGTFLLALVMQPDNPETRPGHRAAV